MKRNLALLAAAAGLTALYWPALRGDQIFAFRDMLQNYTPMMELFWRGPSMLWNGHAFGGSSILADLVQQPLYLPNLLFRLLHMPAWPGIAIYQWAHALFGLWTASVLARRFSAAPACGAVAAAAFALCGFSLANASDMQFPCAAAWVPAVLLAADLWGAEGGLGRAALLGLVLPQPFLAGDPLLSALLAAAAVGLAAWRRSQLPAGPFWRDLALAAAAAALIAAPQVIATWRGLQLMTRSSGFSLYDRELWSLHPVRVLELFVPRLFGPLLGDGFWGGFTTGPYWKRNYVHSIYAGAAGPLLVLLALRDRASRPWLALGAAALALALGSHFFHLFGAVTSLPVLRAFRYPERLFALFVPAWAVLLALGSARLFGMRPATRALLICGSCAFALLALFLTAVFAPSFDRAAVIRSASQILLFGAACSLAVLLPRGAPLAFAAVLTVDLCAANAGLLGLLPRDLFRGEPAACAALDLASGGAPRDSFRVYVDQERLEQGSGTFAEQRVREYQFGKRNMLEQCGFRETAAVTSFDPRAERDLWVRAGPLPELRALGARFAVTAPGNARMFGGRELLVDRKWQIAIDSIDGAPPLLFRPEQVEQLSRDQLLAAAPHRPDLLGAKITALETAPRQHLPDPGARLLELHDLGARIDFRVTQGQPGYWVLAATLDQDWRAELDGSPAEIVPGDGVRRAVWLPAGEHGVTLRHRPLLVLSLFGLSLLLYAGLLALAYASRRTPGAAI